jgi:soluble lytic murein transglycosylase-like protein
VPELWIERVMRAESRGLTTLAGRPITSRAGAMGLMQIMPATWRRCAAVSDSERTRTIRATISWPAPSICG